MTPAYSSQNTHQTLSGQLVNKDIGGSTRAYSALKILLPLGSHSTLFGYIAGLTRRADGWRNQSTALHGLIHLQFWWDYRLEEKRYLSQHAWTEPLVSVCLLVSKLLKVFYPAAPIRPKIFAGALSYGLVTQLNASGVNKSACAGLQIINDSLSSFPACVSKWFGFASNFLSFRKCVIGLKCGTEVGVWLDMGLQGIHNF